MIEKVRQNIREGLDEAKNPVMMCSFGKDSMLLLSLIREVKDIPLIWFQDDMTFEEKRFAKKIIAAWDLTVYSYLAAHKYFVPNGDDLTLVSEYAVNGFALPLLTNIEHSDKCGLLLSQKRTPQARWNFDVTFTGWKKADSHPLLPNVNLDNLDYAGTKFVSPLKDLSDDEVFEMLAMKGIPSDEQRYAGGVNSDVLYACTRCLQGSGVTCWCPDEKRFIPMVEWDRTLMATTFNERFNPQEI